LGGSGSRRNFPNLGTSLAVALTRFLVQKMVFLPKAQQINGSLASNRVLRPRIWNPQALWQVDAWDLPTPCRVQLGGTAD